MLKKVRDAGLLLAWLTGAVLAQTDGDVIAPTNTIFAPRDRLSWIILMIQVVIPQQKGRSPFILDATGIVSSAIVRQRAINDIVP